MKSKIKAFFKTLCKQKYSSAKAVALTLSLCIILVTISACGSDENIASSSNLAELSSLSNSKNLSSAISISSEETSNLISSDETSDLVSSKIENSSEISSFIESPKESSEKINTSTQSVTSKGNSGSKNTGSSSSKKATTTTTTKKPTNKNNYQYNTNLNIEDNVFMDSLIYTGYNMKKHRADGKMWIYILAKYKRGYGWLSNITYAGGSTGYETKNGPEMCAVERMLYGPEPQWPMMVVTTPSNIRMAATLEVELKDDSGKPISGVNFSLKSSETGKSIKLGKTDKKGMITKDCLSYGEYTLIQSSIPKGYTAKKTETKIKLTTANNSKNSLKIVNAKNKAMLTSSQKSVTSSSTTSQNSSTTTYNDK